jgi:hypothetical protein
MQLAPEAREDWFQSIKPVTEPSALKMLSSGSSDTMLLLEKLPWKLPVIRGYFGPGGKGGQWPVPQQAA